MRLSYGLGALAERDYRLLFSATTVTALGDAIAAIALAFAVLDFGSATDLGIVFAARQIATTGVVLFGGVLSDRLPRNRVLVGASLVSGTAQAVLAVTVLSGNASLLAFVVLGVLYGCGEGLVFPAEIGLIPQTVSPGRLQQANALQGLSRSGVRVLGPAIGGLLVVAASPGVALALDSASFLVCAVLLVQIRIPPKPDAERQHFLHELREGWREFSSRTWLWGTVIFGGLANAFATFWNVLGPAVANEQLGGAGAWAVILAAGGVGSIIGGLLALRYRPSRPLAACMIWLLALVPQLVALATGTPTWAIAACAFGGGLGIAIGLTLWLTVFQREIPAFAQSRVSSYDTLGSLVLIPLGAVLAGPLAAALGTEDALLIAAGGVLFCVGSMLLIPAVWRIRAAPAAAT